MHFNKTFIGSFLMFVSAFFFVVANAHAEDARLSAAIDRIFEDIENNAELYPHNAQLLDVQLKERSIVLIFDSTLAQHINHASAENMLHRLAALYPEFEGVEVIIDDGGRRNPIDSYLEQPESVTAVKGTRNESIRGIDGESVFPYDGALKGKRIAISPGHGWYWWEDNSTWNTQRSLVNGIVEDFTNARLADWHVVPALEHAGATVFNCRERDFNTDEIIVDDGSVAPLYTDDGGWWDGAYVVGYGNGKYRVNNATSPDQNDKSAAWTPDFPADGTYAVYINFTSGSNRVTDARYTVIHAGGESTLLVDQTVNGSRWLYIGSYAFAKGSNGQGVYLSTLSSEADGIKVVIADAVKFGGGMGSTVRNGQPSGKPRWQEAARYWVEFVGAPESTYNPSWAENDADVTTRPLYANWQGVDAYISLHSNAFDGTARGVGTWRYDGSNSSYPITDGSTELRNYIQEEVLGAIRAEWDSGWVNYGLHTANFGELRVLEEAPGALLELGFHDNAQDAAWLLKPHFRETVARAITKAVFRYFGVTAPLPPRRILNLRTEVVTPGSIRLSWQPQTETTWEGEGVPDSYRIYVSTDGYGFDNGTISTGETHYDFDDLELGRTYYFRVAGVNTGGESLISEPVAARINCTQKPALLIVNGFDRTDRSIQEENNTRDYVVRHARAIENAGNYFFVSASNEAFDSYDLSAADIEMIDWISGEEAGTGGDTLFQALNVSRRQKLADFLSTQNGALFISGSEIAWDAFVGANDEDYKSWINTYLKADYVSDDAGEYNFVGVEDTIFAGLSGTFDDGTHGTYDVDWPDVLEPYDDSSICATYNDKSKGLAVCKKCSAEKLVYLGIPFETLVGDELRNEVMSRILNFIGEAQQSPFCEEDGDADGDDSGDEDYQIDGDEDFATDGDEVIDGDSEAEAAKEESDSSYSIIIGPKGGRLVTDQGLEIYFPSGALDEEVEITVSIANDVDISPYVAIGDIWRFEPAGLQFNLPVTVNMPYDQSRINEGSNAFYWSAAGSESDFGRIGGAELNNGIATALINHFSIGFVGYKQQAETDGDEIAADGDGDKETSSPDGDGTSEDKDSGGCNQTGSGAAGLLLSALCYMMLLRRRNS